MVLSQLLAGEQPKAGTGAAGAQRGYQRCDVWAWIFGTVRVTAELRHPLEKGSNSSHERSG